MTKMYLLVPFPSGRHVPAASEQQRTVIESLPPQIDFEVGDKLLRMYSRNGIPEGVLPSVETVVHPNREQDLLTVETERALTREAPAAIIRTILKRPFHAGVFELTTSEFAAITDYMSTVLLKESDFLTHIKCYIAAKGYYFDDETLFNYHICLKTRPFVVLAGLSGTGKSKLTQLYAEAMGHTRQNKRYLRLAVRPGWNDDRFLLGYFNTITGEYITEPAVDFLLRAGNDLGNLYFFCLDEMNLAHVEHYFSQFLSALEEEDPLDRVISLLSEEVWAHLEKSDRGVRVAPSVLIPPNLLFIGTVNIDETTQALSDKVIDRANTIEFFTVDLEKLPEHTSLLQPLMVSSWCWQSYIVRQPDSSYRSTIAEIGKILHKADLGLGYRILRDVELYLANSRNILSPQIAFDLQVKQRILPHVRGTDFIEPVLDELEIFMRQHGLNRSEIRLEEMKKRLKRNGYTSFWR